MNDSDESLSGPIVLAKARKVSLASVLLRTLERLCANDGDQVFLDLYNELKPLAERGIRRRDRN